MAAHRQLWQDLLWNGATLNLEYYQWISTWLSILYSSLRLRKSELDKAGTWVTPIWTQSLVWSVVCNTVMPLSREWIQEYSLCFGPRCSPPHLCFLASLWLRQLKTKGGDFLAKNTALKLDQTKPWWGGPSRSLVLESRLIHCRWSELARKLQGASSAYQLWACSWMAPGLVQGERKADRKDGVWLSLNQLSFKGKINLRNLPPETYKQVTLASRVREGQGSMQGDGMQNGNGIGDEGWILSCLIPHAGPHFCEDLDGIKCNSHGPAGQIWQRARWASWPAPERTRS